MKYMLSFGALTMAVLLISPESAESQNKDRNKNSNVTPAMPDDYKTLARNKESTGIIASADAKSLTFRIDLPHVEPAGGKVYKLRPSRSVRLVHEYKEFDLGVAESVVVKKMFVNADYDDKGNFKINEAAQKELRSKGYIASTINDIKPGNLAKIVLSTSKQDSKDEGILSRPVVKTIYLVGEGTPIESSKGPEKKKKG